MVRAAPQRMISTVVAFSGGLGGESLRHMIRALEGVPLTAAPCVSLYAATFAVTFLTAAHQFITAIALRGAARVGFVEPKPIERGCAETHMFPSVKKRAQ